MMTFAHLRSALASTMSCRSPRLKFRPLMGQRGRLVATSSQFVKHANVPCIEESAVSSPFSVHRSNNAQTHPQKPASPSLRMETLG